MSAPDPRLGEIESRSDRALIHENLAASSYAEMAWDSARDVPYLLAELRKRDEALDALMYIADKKAADNMIGRWWAGVIKGTIHSHMNPAPKPEPTP